MRKWREKFAVLLEVAKKRRKWKRNFFSPWSNYNELRESGKLPHHRWAIVQTIHSVAGWQFDCKVNAIDLNAKQTLTTTKSMIREPLGVGRTERKKKKGAKLTFAWDIICRHWDWKCVSSSWWVGKSSSSSSKQVMWKKWKLTRKHKIVWAVWCCFFRVWNGSEWKWSGRKRGIKLKKVIERWEGGEDGDIKWKSTAHSPASYTTPNPHLLCHTDEHCARAAIVMSSSTSLFARRQRRRWAFSQHPNEMTFFIVRFTSS